MKAIDGLIRLHRWRLDEKRLKLSELERLVGTLREEMRKLGETVIAERGVAAHSTEAAYGFGVFAAKAVERRHCLEKSLSEAEEQVKAAAEEVAEAFRELKKFDIVKSRETRLAGERSRRQEQAALDEIVLTLYRRNKKESVA
jgi:flagellar export protein FliJ